MMTTSYKKMMHSVVLNETQKAKIRRNLQGVEETEKAPARRRWGRPMLAIAALFLLGAGVYQGVKAHWRNQQFGQYLFELSAESYCVPTEKISAEFLQEAKTDCASADDKKAFYGMQNWQAAVDKIEIPLLSSPLIDKSLKEQKENVNITASCDADGNVQDVTISAVISQPDEQKSHYTVWYSAEFLVDRDAAESVSVGNDGVADTTIIHHNFGNGITAQIAVSKSGEKIKQINTYFVKDNILYHVYADIWGREKGTADIPMQDFLVLLDSLALCTPET